MDANDHMLLEMTDASSSGTAQMKDMDGNVNDMKTWLIDNIGDDWSTVTRANENSNLGIGRRMKPWAEISAAMSKELCDSVSSLVARHDRKLTSTFFAFEDEFF